MQIRAGERSTLVKPHGIFRIPPILLQTLLGAYLPVLVGGLIGLVLSISFGERLADMLNISPTYFFPIVFGIIAGRKSQNVRDARWSWAIPLFFFLLNLISVDLPLWESLYWNVTAPYATTYSLSQIIFTAPLIAAVACSATAQLRYQRSIADSAA